MSDRIRDTRDYLTIPNIARMKVPNLVLVLHSKALKQPVNLMASRPANSPLHLRQPGTLLLRGRAQADLPALLVLLLG